MSFYTISPELKTLVNNLIAEGQEHERAGEFAEAAKCFLDAGKASGDNMLSRYGRRLAQAAELTA